MNLSLLILLLLLLLLNCEGERAYERDQKQEHK
jgi:hypothetical protein